MVTDERYGIAELAEAGGVSRRTVRYYVQEGLLPAPLGVGRGRHYGPEHLQRLLEVKALQEQGLSLGEIRTGDRRTAGQAGHEQPVAPRTAWTRIELLPGVELNVAAGRRVPPPARLAELIEWCRTHVAGPEED